MELGEFGLQNVELQVSSVNRPGLWFMTGWRRRDDPLEKKNLGEGPEVRFRLTVLPVLPLHVDAEHGDLLPLHRVFVEVDEGHGDGPGRQVSLVERRGGGLGGGVVLHDDGGLLHLHRRLR